MMQSVFSRRVAFAPAVQQGSSQRSSRSLVVRATSEETTRRAAVGAALLSAVALLPLAAEAKIKNPAQDSLKRGGSSTQASMSAFDMGGIKKRGIKPDQRRSLIDGVKAKAKALAGGGS